MPNKTPLYAKHRESNAKMVDFAGWNMPIHYGSLIEEHHQVRRDAGMFDVSHMVVLDIDGKEATTFLRKLLANDVNKLTQLGKALYSCMLNDDGGIIDDLIIYNMGDNSYRMVINAACKDNDLRWITKQANDFDVRINERDDLAMIAIQGPNARQKVMNCFSSELAQRLESINPFYGVMFDTQFIARTGYTGEDGFEIMLPANEAESLWDCLLERGVKPIGLGARDTLRLEAGMNLYGMDMNEKTSPLVSGLEWTVAWQPDDRDFIGRNRLTQEKQAGISKKFVGLILEGKGILRAHQQVITNSGDKGEITSGTFSPTLKKSIAFARVPSDIGDTCSVVIRNKNIQAKVVKTAFVRHGQAV